ncbi:MAG: hypothetical protein AAF821_23540 [Cyanobacteria bacterium P01_D01_bin.156]
MGSLVLMSCSSQAVDSEQVVQEADPRDNFEKSIPVALSTNKQSVKSNDITIPSTYQITIQGETEAGAFNEIEATLELKPTDDPDSNPILVELYPSNFNQDSLTNGHLFWQSYTPELPTADEHFSRVTVEGNQVSLEVNPSETFRSDVMWFTQLTGTLAELPGMQRESTRLGAMAETGTLTFQVQGSRIMGEVAITGISDLGTPSTYTATFSGQVL